MQNSQTLGITGNAVLGDGWRWYCFNILAVSGTKRNKSTTLQRRTQTYTGAVTLGENAVATTNSDIIFGSNLDGSHTLSLTGTGYYFWSTVGSAVSH